MLTSENILKMIVHLYGRTQRAVSLNDLHNAIVAQTKKNVADCDLWDKLDELLNLGLIEKVLQSNFKPVARTI
ncbi:MAG: hypothetical protein IKR48_03775 [Kiritimatiellae bacterium]|nr:hypothetical protein [Kiritimatiellia bacterium]